MCGFTLKILILLLLLLPTFTSVISDQSSACALKIVPAYEDYEYVQDGDIIIGGMFSVHSIMVSRKLPESPYMFSLLCMMPLNQFYRNLQTFLFVVDQINKDATLLPNLTLGYHIYDSCSQPKKAIRSVLQMLSGPGVTVPNYSCRENWRLAGFIGGQSSITTLPIAELLTVYKYLVISYGATDPALSSRQHFPTFFRTIHEDREVFASICKLIKYFGWTWVGIITSLDESGVRESWLLSHFLTNLHICVGFVVYEGHRLQYTRDSEYQENFETAQKQLVQVVILCGTYHDHVFRSPIAEWLKGVTIILIPSWAPNSALIEKYPQIFNGSLSVEPLSVVTSEFTHFIDDFYPLKYPKDLLLQSLWMMKFHCLSGDIWKNKLYEWIINTPLHNCTGLERMKSTWSNLSDEMFDPVYNAVMLIANALNPIRLSPNDWYGNQTSYRYQISHNLKHLKHRGHAAINEDGELETKYQITNNIIVNGTWHKITVGVFLPSTSHTDGIPINDSLIKWKTINNEIPKSRCSEPCPPGSRKVPANRRQPCCYGCAPCSQGEISNESESDPCRRCPDHEWPNEKKTQCIPKMVEFLSYSGDVISVIVLSGSMLLLTLTAGILGIFISYQETSIVRANNKNLSFVLLVSILLSFLCVFLFLGRPVDGTCMLRQISAGILLSVSVSSLLAKTIMVCIAFKATKPGNVWRRWTGVKFSNCVLLICSSVQVVLCMSWVTFSPPFQELDTHSYKEKIIVQCNEGSDLCFYSVLGYMGILAAVSFITAFLVRTLPDSFNEAKNITFSMLVFCSVWIAMIPAYLSTKGKYMVAVEIFAILTSNAGLLGCIFVPKCCIILFRPELNTRKHILEPRNTKLHQ